MTDGPGDRTRARSVAIVVASTRAATGVYADRTGPIIAEWFTGRGWIVDRTEVVSDGYPVRAALEAAIGTVDVVITTGGTGISPTDRTPEVTLPLLDRELPGVMEELRRRGAASTPLAVLSRGHAGVAGRTFIVNLPGSTGGVRDGLTVLGDVLDHIVDQLQGVDHDR